MIHKKRKTIKSIKKNVVQFHFGVYCGLEQFELPIASLPMLAFVRILLVSENS